MRKLSLLSGCTCVLFAVKDTKRRMCLTGRDNCQHNSLFILFQLSWASYPIKRSPNYKIANYEKTINAKSFSMIANVSLGLFPAVRRLWGLCYVTDPPLSEHCITTRWLAGSLLHMGSRPWHVDHSEHCFTNVYKSKYGSKDGDHPEVWRQYPLKPEFSSIPAWEFARKAIFFTQKQNGHRSVPPESAWKRCTLWKSQFSGGTDEVCNTRTRCFRAGRTCPLEIFGACWTICCTLIDTGKKRFRLVPSASVFNTVTNWISEFSILSMKAKPQLNPTKFVLPAPGNHNSISYFALFFQRAFLFITKSPIFFRIVKNTGSRYRPAPPKNGGIFVPSWQSSPAKSDQIMLTTSN